MDKGARVRILSGRGRGQLGTVFWTGENRYGPGMRLGVEGDDGRTWWINEADAEAVSGSEDPGPPALPSFSRGDRVAWTVGGVEGTGKVFWVGESRRGGQRLGIDDDHGEEAVWLDARQVRPLGEVEALPREASAPADPVGEEVAPSTWEAAPDPGEVPPLDAPPTDDDWYDELAAEVDEEEPPDAW